MTALSTFLIIFDGAALLAAVVLLGVVIRCLWSEYKRAQAAPQPSAQAVDFACRELGDYVEQWAGRYVAPLGLDAVEVTVKLANGTHVAITTEPAHLAA